MRDDAHGYTPDVIACLLSHERNGVNGSSAFCK